MARDYPTVCRRMCSDVLRCGLDAGVCGLPQLAVLYGIKDFGAFRFLFKNLGASCRFLLIIMFIMVIYLYQQLS
jgi:hypothetical protein